MPLPQQHLNRLESDLAHHDRELKALESRPKKDTDRIVFHKTILSVGRDKSIHAALSELHDKPELADQLKKKPESFLQTRGIHLPPTATGIVVNPDARDSLTVGINFVIKRVHFRLEWNKESGFCIRQLPRIS